MKYVQIREPFSHDSTSRMAPIPLWNGACFVQALLESSQTKSKKMYEMSALTTFSVVFDFHGIFLISSEVVSNKLNNNKAQRIARLQSWWFPSCKNLGMGSQIYVHLGPCGLSLNETGWVLALLRYSSSYYYSNGTVVWY